MKRPPDEEGRLPDDVLARVVGGLDEAGLLRWGPQAVEWWLPGLPDDEG